MRLTRRQFIGLVGAFGLAGRASAGSIFSGRGNKGFSVAAVNDLHVLDLRSASIVNRAVEQINRDARIAFTAVLGDLSTDAKLTELNLAHGSLQRLKQPYYAVPGNHDIDMTNKNIYANYEHVFGVGNWKKEHGGWVFIGFDSCEENKTDVVVRPDRIEWLQKQVAHIKQGKPIGLFCHHPLAPNAKGDRVKNADEVLALFAGHNLKLAAAGHFHGNQVEEKDGVLFTTTACLSTSRDNHDNTTAKGYRLFHITGETVETEFVEVS